MHFKVQKYVTKYASKPEKNSNCFNSAFAAIFSDANSRLTSTQTALRDVITRVLGQRDIGLFEAEHSLLSEKLHESNIQVVTVSLKSTPLIKRNNNNQEVEFEDSSVDLYARRKDFIEVYPEILRMNFMEFVRMFKPKLLNKRLVKYSNPETIAIRIYQKYSSSRKSPYYHLHSKFMLLRYKPWVIKHENVLDSFADDEEGWIEAWHDFVLSEEGTRRIPSWHYLIARAQVDIELEPAGEEDDDDGLLIDGERREETLLEDWMDNQAPDTEEDGIYKDNSTDIDLITYWQEDKAFYDQQTLNIMNNWIPYHKSRLNVTAIERPIIDITTLNQEQKVAYDLVYNHIMRKDSKQLLLRLEGTAGTGRFTFLFSIQSIDI